MRLTTPQAASALLALSSACRTLRCLRFGNISLSAARLDSRPCLARLAAPDGLRRLQELDRVLFAVGLQVASGAASAFVSVGRLSSLRRQDWDFYTAAGPFLAAKLQHEHARSPLIATC